jgi:predicted negative regulator of RcsB-dependent stress response
VSEHLTRKDLRTDGFAVAVEHNVEYVSEHRKQLIQYGVIAVVAILAAVGIYAYLTHSKTVREEQLSEAIGIQESQVTPAAAPGSGSYTTEEAKTTAAQKAFAAVAAEHSSAKEGQIAEYYLGCIAADAGKLDEAKAHFQKVADSNDKDYSALANLSLAEVDYMQNRPADGEKRLRGLIEHPTLLVSKDQATISLARHLLKTNPAEAKKLLEPLVKQPNAASQIAVGVLSEIK